MVGNEFISIQLNMGETPKGYGMNECTGCFVSAAGRKLIQKLNRCFKTTWSQYLTIRAAATYLEFDQLDWHSVLLLFQPNTTQKLQLSKDANEIIQYTTNPSSRDSNRKMNKSKEDTSR